MSGVGTWSAIGFFFAVFSGLVLALVRSEIRVLRERIDGTRGELVERIDGVRREMTVRFDALNARFDSLERSLRSDGEPASREEKPAA